jgi:hypothetical protein
MASVGYVYRAFLGLIFQIFSTGFYRPPFGIFYGGWGCIQGVCLELWGDLLGWVYTIQRAAVAKIIGGWGVSIRPWPHTAMAMSRYTMSCAWFPLL